jgi:PKD domain
MRRFAPFLFALLLLAAPASALADDQVTIEPAGGEARTLSISQLGDPDVVARPYTLPGGSAPVPITGYSLDRVLDAAGVDPVRFGSLEIQATSGSVVLTRDEATGTTTFPEGPPVFYVENADGRFLRPARANGESAELATGGPMTVELAERGELSVSAKASPRRAEVGQPVRFTATVTGAEPGESVEITWFFDDRRSKAGSEVTHRFRRPGTYEVTVGATRSENEPGASAIVTVRVGKKPAGPDQQGGGTGPDENAPDSGAGTGSTGSTGSTGGSGVTPVTPTTPSTPPSTYEPVDEPPQPPGSGSSQNPTDESGASSDGLEPVEGIELADLNSLSSDAGRDALEAAQRGLKRDPEETDGGVPDGVWWFLAIGGLLSLGGLLELRRRPGDVSAPAR